MATGALLPAWMFINSIQIISHLVLLNTLMPPNAQTFLWTVNDLARWHDPSSSQGNLNQADDTGEGGYTPALILAGYVPLFFANLTLVLIALLVVCAVWALVWIKDYYIRNTRVGKSAPSWLREE